MPKLAPARINFLTTYRSQYLLKQPNMMHNKTDMGSDHDNYLYMTIETGPVKRRILLLIRSIEVLLNGYFKHLIGLNNAFK
jgi:hypothetical protein